MGNELKNTLRGKIVVIGVGNRLRGDDGIGPELVDRLKSQISGFGSRIELIDAGEVPENYLAKIAKCRPDTILLVDAVDFGGAAGETELFKPEDLTGGSLSTHNASLELVAGYLTAETGAAIFLLGVQPESLRMNSGLSTPVKQTLDRIEGWLIECTNSE